eukprot:jgi/Botrbrau1/9342/Bobra.354_2s0001.1
MTPATLQNVRAARLPFQKFCGPRVPSPIPARVVIPWTEQVMQQLLLLHMCSNYPMQYSLCAYCGRKFTGSAE